MEAGSACNLQEAYFESCLYTCREDQSQLLSLSMEYIHQNPPASKDHKLSEEKSEHERKGYNEQTELAPEEI